MEEELQQEEEEERAVVSGGHAGAEGGLPLLHTPLVALSVEGLLPGVVEEMVVLPLLHRCRVEQGDYPEMDIVG